MRVIEQNVAKTLFASCIAITAAVVSSTGSGQAYPTKPVRLLVATLTSPKLVLLLGLAIVCPVVSEWVWRVSVRRYTSASS